VLVILVAALLMKVVISATSLRLSVLFKYLLLQQYDDGDYDDREKKE
jgi:hypothetical protein